MLLLPDTPRWYYATNRTEDGDNVLARLHGLPLHDDRVQAQKEEIQASIRLEESEKSKFNMSLLLWDATDLRIGRRIRMAFLMLSIKQMMGKIKLQQRLQTHFLLMILIYSRNQHDGLLQSYDICPSWLIALPLATARRSYDDYLRLWNISPTKHYRAVGAQIYSLMVGDSLYHLDAHICRHDWIGESNPRHPVDSSRSRDLVHVCVWI